MSRQKLKSVRSFALKLETLEAIREVTAEAQIAGGASGLVEDACAAWIKRYRNDPKQWLADRGLAHTSTPVHDDL